MTTEAPADGSTRSTRTGGSPRRRGRWPVVAIGIGLAVFGAGTVAYSADASRTAPLAGPNVAVNAGARDPVDLRQNNSPTIVRSPVRPRELAVVNRIDNPRFDCALHTSSDAGATWRERPIPFPEDEEAPPRCYGPDAAFGADGVLYVSFVTLSGLGNTPNAVWVSSSGDGGRTLSPPTRVAGRLAFQVRLVADPRVPGRLHLSWLQAGATGTLLFPDVGNPIVTVRSDDGGDTWSDPVQVSAPERKRPVAPSPAVADNGRLHVVYLDLGEDALDYNGGHEGRGGDPYPGRWSLVLARSTDGGRTWSESVVDARVVPTARFVVFLPPTPSILIDERGRLHVGFTDGRLGDADVWLWTSTDGGTTFAPPRRVNETPRGDRTSQYLPRLGMSGDGRLDVVYYDRRDDRDDTRNMVSLQSSTDGGRTFGPRVTVSDRSFDSRIGFGSERGLPDLGSRLGLVSDRRRALAVWADTRGGTVSSGKQDLAAASVTFPSRRAGHPAVKVLGALLAVAGVLVLVRALVRRGQAAATPATGERSVSAPVEPENDASPKANTPPSEATNQ